MEKLSRMQRVSSTVLWGEVDNVKEGMCYTPNVSSASNLELCRQRQRGSTRLRRLGFDVVRVRADDERIQDGRCDRVGRD